ncbi:hypothetical protein MPLDJ20_60059 [Mesorhizobium plurifarium]|uniref:Uncharacterized protein n=1 Tax=Mesorhizobium plurifarium TaxID=69974 RepID=A0A090FGI3_MESPL|nr:hypothetical protein MPLDJ20_60059 [Mesorhizobium plurifarium]
MPALSKALCDDKKNTKPARVGPVAQWLEPAAHNRLVGGSSPSGPTMTFDFIDENWPRPKTFWAHYGPSYATSATVCSGSII